VEKKSANLDEAFNRNLLAIICMLGLSMNLYELISNGPDIVQPGFYLDLSYAVIFLFTLISLSYRLPNRIIHFTFYIPLILLLCLTLVIEKGLAGSIENNIHVGIIIITLTMSGSDAWKFSLLLIIGTIASLAVAEYQHGFFENYADYSTSTANYVFMGVGIVIVMYSAKQFFEAKRLELSKLKSELSTTYLALDQSNLQLEEQTTKLEMLNKDLEKKVEERIAYLNRQKIAIKNYMQVTVNELEEEHADLQERIINTVERDDDISKMIHVSSDRLNTEIKSLMTKLDTEQ